MIIAACSSHALRSLVSSSIDFVGGKIDATTAPGRVGELNQLCVQSAVNLSPPGFFLGKVHNVAITVQNQIAFFPNYSSLQVHLVQ